MGKKEGRFRVSKKDAVFCTLLALYLVSGLSYSVYMGGKFASLEGRIASLEEKMLQVWWKNDCGKEFSEKYDGVFIYTQGCPHSKMMKPLVIRSNISWYWIDVTSPKCSKLNLTEFGYKGGVPHFYCTRTGESHTGAMREEDFNEWVMSCVGG